VAKLSSNGRSPSFARHRRRIQPPRIHEIGYIRSAEAYASVSNAGGGGVRRHIRTKWRQPRRLRIVVLRRQAAPWWLNRASHRLRRSLRKKRLYGRRNRKGGVLLCVLSLFPVVRKEVFVPFPPLCAPLYLSVFGRNRDFLPGRLLSASRGNRPINKRRRIS